MDWLIVEKGSLGVGSFSSLLSSMSVFVVVYEDDSVDTIPLCGVYTNCLTNEFCYLFCYIKFPTYIVFWCDMYVPSLCSVRFL